MDKGELKRRIAATCYRALYWGQNHVAPGMRSLIGFMLMVGGVFGFLPVLGFWMFPLGIAFVALDVPMARHKIDDWMTALAREARLTHVSPAEKSPPADDQPADDNSTSSQ
jgi:hypothetical protein